MNFLVLFIPTPIPISNTTLSKPVLIHNQLLSAAIFLVHVSSPEMVNKTLTGTLDSHNDGVKECKGWFSQNLPWEELRDGQKSVVSCIGKGS